MVLTFFTDKGWARGWKDRGGISYALKAYLEEFTSKDNVRFIIKINMAYGTNIENFIKELNIKNEDKPKLSFITQNLNFEELPKIYQSADIFVCSSLAEGFGLGNLQAMAMGIPCISNNFGGQTDFINEKNGWLLKEGTLKEISDEILYEGIKWKDVNIDELKKMMRYCYENPNEIKEKGKQSYQTAQKFTWDIAAKKAMNFINELK